MRGSGPKAVRELFGAAREQLPCVVFIDELDSCGAKRVAFHGDDEVLLTQTQERDNTLNQLLSEMDGFVQQPDVVVLAATNRLDVLDPALVRAGRFDRKIAMDLPDDPTRAAIFGHYAKRLLLSPSCDATALSETVALACAGRSGADLELVVNEAALLAARSGADAVSTEHVAHAVDQVMGAAGHYRQAEEIHRKLRLGPDA